jgi:hypothetical protein
LIEAEVIVQTLSLGFPGRSADKRVEPGPSRPSGGEHEAVRHRQVQLVEPSSRPSSLEEVEDGERIAKPRMGKIPDSRGRAAASGNAPVNEVQRA